MLIATDVLSEGQNRQDCFIIVNYDLPWAIIRLIQRAGRVDRIGQQSNQILLLHLPSGRRRRAHHSTAGESPNRLQQNAEVVGTDEAFFDDDKNNKAVTDLYHEKSGLLDGDEIPKSTLPLTLTNLEECNRSRPSSQKDHSGHAERRVLRPGP